MAEIALIGRPTTDPLRVSIGRLRHCPEENITTQDAIELLNEEAHTNGEPLMGTSEEPVVQSNEVPIVEVNEEEALDTNKEPKTGMDEESGVENVKHKLENARKQGKVDGHQAETVEIEATITGETDASEAHTVRNSNPPPSGLQRSSPPTQWEEHLRKRKKNCFRWVNLTRMSTNKDGEM